MRPKIDLDSYLRSRVAILNESGGRSYENGIRAFDCPYCDDTKGRGWLNIVYWTAGCFNAGCPACKRVDGGAIEWARAAEGFDTRTEVIIYLKNTFPGTGFEAILPAPPAQYDDFCRFPSDMRPFLPSTVAPMVQLPFEKFVKRQWPVLDVNDLIEAGAGYCLRGDHAWRIIFPIVMGSVPVGFQARTIYEAGGATKYLTSRYGPRTDPGAECGRPQAAMLYGADTLAPGDEAVVVEGIADVLAGRKSGLKTVAPLGIHLTGEHLGILAKARPKRVILAIDTGPVEDTAREDHVTSLEAWGIHAAPGRWEGAKDAAAGGKLVISSELSLAGRLARRLQG
jgi:hypothetical protein